MSFEDYLKEKKIDTSTFKNNEQERWQEWNSIFAELSPASFTAQKLYLLNPIRRKYPLKANQEPITSGITSQTVTSDQKPQASKPVFRPKMK